MFEIICKELTSSRKNILSDLEVITFSKPMRGVMGVGGVWIFYSATSLDLPLGVKGIAGVFAAAGIAAVLMAIFAQKLIEISYFSKAAKKGCFPASVSVGEGGVFIRRRDTKKEAKKTEVTSVNAERFFAYAEVGKIEEYNDYFKMNFLRADTAGVFLFKEDFGKGDPEAFKMYINSKKAAL